MHASLAGRPDADARLRPAALGLQPGLGGLEGKRALVTGGTRGMGEAVAGLLAAHKVRVVVVARNGVSSSPARGSSRPISRHPAVRAWSLARQPGSLAASISLCTVPGHPFPSPAARSR